MLMIEPLPFFSMPGRKARATRYMDFTFRLKLKSQSFGVQSRMVPWCTKPTQLNSTSSGPTSPASLLTAAWSVTARTCVLMPWFSSSATVFPLMSVAHTWATSRAKASAAPRPMPWPAAVTKAILPARRPAIDRCPLPGRAAIILRVSMNKLDFTGRTAVVTGGVTGIGAAIAKRLKASGAAVVIWDLDGSPRVDVSDANSIQNALKNLGKVDVLVNNAGIAGKNVPTVDYPVEEWERVLRVNLTSQFLCCRAVAPLMVKANYGRIVNIASVAGKEGNPNAVAYSASKAGVISLTKSLGKELAQAGVLVNCVTPAAAKTAIFDQMTRQHIDYMLSKIPMGRFVEVDEIAALVCWLASEDCSFSTGGVFDISGGRATY